MLRVVCTCREDVIFHWTVFCDVISVKIAADSRILWSLNDVAACLPIVSAVAVAVRVTDTGLSVLTGTLVAIMTVGSSETYIIMYRPTLMDSADNKLDITKTLYANVHLNLSKEIRNACLCYKDRVIVVL